MQLSYFALIAFTLVAFTLIEANAAEQFRLRDDQAVKADGSIVEVPETAQLMKRQDMGMNAALATTRLGAAHPILPPTKANLSEPEIAQALDIVFQFGRSSSYQYYIFRMPESRPLKFEVAAYAGQMQGQLHPYKPYQGVGSSAAIKLTIPTGFNAIQDNNGICVVLDTFGTPVPIPVAEAISANFTNGFVARIVLGEYMRQWRGSGLTVPDDLDFPFQPLPIPAAFTKADNYTGDFNKQVETLLQNNSLNATGILLGWAAGGEFDKLRGTPNEKYFRAIWRLVRNRYTVSDIGEMTAFTLNYMVGFANAAAGRNYIAASGQVNVTQLQELLAKDDKVFIAKTLLTRLHRAFLAEFYVLAADQQLAQAEPEQYRRMISDYFSFIEGFEQGSVKAADQVFLEVFKLAYGYGYKDGYKDGYSKGYADGYRDGYAVGYNEAWSKANAIISQLTGQIDSLNSLDTWLGRGKTIVGIGVAVLGVFGL